MWEVIKEEDWVLCGATNSISNWPQRLWTIDKPYRLIRGGGAAANGTGIGIAVGLALVHRDKKRIVVNIQIAGDLLYEPGALWTAAPPGLPNMHMMHIHSPPTTQMMPLQHLPHS